MILLFNSTFPRLTVKVAAIIFLPSVTTRRNATWECFLFFLQLSGRLFGAIRKVEGGKGWGEVGEGVGGGGWRGGG